MKNTRKLVVIILIVALVFSLATVVTVLTTRLFNILYEISKEVTQTNKVLVEIYSEDVKREHIDNVMHAIEFIEEKASDEIERTEKIHHFISKQMQEEMGKREEQRRLQEEEEAKQTALIAAGGQPLYEFYVDDICNNLYPDVPASMIKAMITRESHWNPTCLGDHGTSYGLMQIKPKWHQWRADKLGVTDWLDPYGNILVGVDMMNDYIHKYNSLALALMVYNGGAKYAQNNYEAGIISNYARGVLEEAGLPVR